jgi:hypothetical protein
MLASLVVVVLPWSTTPPQRPVEAAGVIERLETGHGSDDIPTDACWDRYPIIAAMDAWGQRGAGAATRPISCIRAC